MIKDVECVDDSQCMSSHMKQAFNDLQKEYQRFHILKMPQSILIQISTFVYIDLENEDVVQMSETNTYLPCQPLMWTKSAQIGMMDHNASTFNL